MDFFLHVAQLVDQLNAFHLKRCFPWYLLHEIDFNCDWLMINWLLLRCISALYIYVGVWKHEGCWEIVVLMFLYYMKHYCKFYCIIFLFLLLAFLVFLKVTGCMCIEIFTSGTVLLLMLIFWFAFEFIVINEMLICFFFFEH